jgi:hypothetical protein
MVGVVLFSINAMAQAPAVNSDCITGGDRIQFPPEYPNLHIAPGGLCLFNTVSDNGDLVVLAFANLGGGLGELVLVDLTTNTTRWCAHLNNQSGPCAVGDEIVFHKNGNLTVDLAGVEQWASNTQGDNNGHEFLKVTNEALGCIVTNDGNVQNTDFCSNNKPE